MIIKGIAGILGVKEERLEWLAKFYFLTLVVVMWVGVDLINNSLN